MDVPIKKKNLLEELCNIDRDYFSGLHEEQNRSKGIWKRNPAVNITTTPSHDLPEMQARTDI